jgi:hypothetical protein
MKTQFTPLEQLIRSLRWWWLVVIISIAGGTVGYLVHGLLPPIYLSRAVITTSINYLQTGILTDEKQDQSVGAVGDLVGSDKVMQATLSQANAQGISIDLVEFKKVSFLDRKEFRWTLGIESTNAQQAADLTNLWAQESMRQLNESLAHAINANSQAMELDRMEACFQQISVVAPGYSTCPKIELNTLQTSIVRNTAQLTNEIQASRGILPAMSFTLTGKANPADSPTYRNRNLMVFAGLLIGFIAGVLISQTLPISNRDQE